MKKILAILLLSVFVFAVSFWISETDSSTKMPKKEIYNLNFDAYQNQHMNNTFIGNNISNFRINSISGVSEPAASSYENIIAVASNDFTLSGPNSRLFISKNSGESFSSILVPLSGNSAFLSASDPSVEFGKDGKLYFAMVNYEPNGKGDGIYVNFSEDYGDTWLENALTVKINNDALVFEDRPAISVGEDGTVYVAWVSIERNGKKILFSKMTDIESGFTNPLIIAEGNVNTPDLISVDNRVFVSYLKNDSQLFFSVSENLGNSFSTIDNPINIIHSGNLIGNEYLIKNTIRVKSYPVLVKDETEKNLFLVYSASSGTDDESDVFFVKFDIENSLFDSPIQLNSDNTSTDQFNPSAVVKNGKLFASWQDSRNDIENLNVETYLGVYDFSTSMIENVLVSSGSFNPDKILLGNYIGDYNSIVALENGIMPIWTDGRLNNFDLFSAFVDYNFTTSIDENNIVIKDYQLQQNFPNPFNPSTTITFAIPEDSFVNLILFNSLGEVIANLIQSDIKRGEHHYYLNAENLSSGVYFYQLTAGSYKSVKKMILQK